MTEHNFAHNTTNSIPRGLNRSQATKSGQKVLTNLEKLAGNDKEKMAEISKFALFMRMIMEQSGLSQEDIKACQAIIVTEFYQNGQSISDAVLNSTIEKMWKHLGRAC